MCSAPPLRLQAQLLMLSAQTDWITGVYILRALRGRQPLCGTGVLSVMDTISSPPMVNPLMADWTQKQKRMNQLVNIYSNTVLFKSYLLSRPAWITIMLFIIKLDKNWPSYSVKSAPSWQWNLLFGIHPNKDIYLPSIYNNTYEYAFLNHSQSNKTFIFFTTNKE